MDPKRYVLLLTLMASALHAAPQLQLSTTALGPINIAPNASGPTQTVTATNIGTGSLALAASATAAWLQPSIVGGSTIQIALNTAALSPGSYTEFVTVSSPGAIDAPQNITVTISVGGVPSSLTFYAAPAPNSTTVGTAVTQQVITQAQAATQASTSTGTAWLSVALSLKGSFTSFFPYNVIVTPQIGQAAGAYTGTVTFSGSSIPADNKQVGVNLQLTTSPIQQFSPAAVQLFSSGTTKAATTVTTVNAGLGTLALTSAQGSTSWLTGTVSGSTVTVTADPTSLTPGTTYQAALTVNSNAANATVTLPVEFVVEPTTAPILSFHGVVDNAAFAQTLSPGMIAQVYGVQLAAATPVVASSLPLGNTLGGVSVSVNGLSAPIYYTSPNVIDFVVPFATQPGPATVTLTYNGVGSNTVSANVVAQAPRILYFPLSVLGQTHYYGIIVNASDGSFPVPTTPGILSHPAKRGDTVTIYLLGMGGTNPAVADGVASPTSPLAVTPSTPTVIIGGGFDGQASDGTVLYSGLTPGFVGLYQINVTIPMDAPLGNAIALEIQLGTATSYPPVYMAISN